MTNRADAISIDTDYADLLGRRAGHEATIRSCFDKMHRNVSDRRTRWGWTKTDDEAYIANLAKGGIDNLIKAIVAAKTEIASIDEAVEVLDKVYAADPWTRYILCLSANGHIHRFTGCSTLHATSQLSWLVNLSAMPLAEAIKEFSEGVCSTCYPDAPAAAREPRERKVDPAKAAAKAAREDAKAAKNLTTDEIFRETGRFGERITTVSACERLIREAIDAEVEVEWYATEACRAHWMSYGNDEDSFAQTRANRASSLTEKQVNAAKAKTVLLQREADHEGWGRTEAQIAKIEASKAKSARKAWLK